MKARKEARFAVGSRLGKRSSIWKVWVQGEDAYLSCRVFAKYQKVSFHSTGLCQWSCTDRWVTGQEGRRNSDRHIVRWQMPETQSGQATLAFKIEIPVSEVRLQPPPTDKKKVFWVNGAPPDATIRFVFFITPESDCDPSPPDTDERRHLFSLRFRTNRWMIIFVEICSLSPSDLSAARAAVIEQLPPGPHEYLLSELRSLLFTQPNGTEAGCNGFIELCLDEA
jgi:hypothetical protein